MQIESFKAFPCLLLNIRSPNKRVWITMLMYYLLWSMQWHVLFNRGYFGVVLLKNSCGLSVVQQMQRCTSLKHFIGSSAVFSQTYLIFRFIIAIYNLVCIHNPHSMMYALTQFLRNLLIILQPLSRHKQITCCFD